MIQLHRLSSPNPIVAGPTSWLKPINFPPSTVSRQDALHGVMLFNPCQSHIEPLEFHAQPSVVDAEAMEDGSVQVMDVYWVGNDVIAEVVGLAMDDARLNARARHPNGKALGWWSRP